MIFFRVDYLRKWNGYLALPFTALILVIKQCNKVLFSPVFMQLWSGFLIGKRFISKEIKSLTLHMVKVDSRFHHVALSHNMHPCGDSGKDNFLIGRNLCENEARFE